MSAAPKVAALRGGHVSLAAAADAFLATARTANPNTHRAYASAIDRVIALLGRDRPLAEVTEAEIGTARLLRLPDGTSRTRGPLFLSERRPVPARRPAAADICPHTGRARLGYDRARFLLEKYAGIDLHQLRHSAATHLGEAEIPLQLIMGKTRHKNPRTAMRYVQPGAEAIASVTEHLAPPRRRHRSELPEPRHSL
ncbi:tyrosine-type recombinase/integrase [Planomonospora parontospora]|uniref:tyrosine-type recombinase/integrase n=1 Tax=Planomonospora parontospora TaxID=58119 RepID=UPI00167040A7|nr:tyrosine-type recombinase/integrase [Planomonospora parontospora]